MTIKGRNRLAAATLTVVAVLAAATMLAGAASPKFYNDDPIWVEPSTQDASGIKASEISLFVDLAYNFASGSSVLNPERAKNLNSVDEVPDSSWFTNRVGFRNMSPEDVATGPNTTAGPAAGNWTVTSSKSDGVTPGFTIKDATGQRWFLKFDPRGHRAMATGTEVAATKLMWALGYNVPENHIAYMHREQLVVGAEAKFTPAGGKSRAMRLNDVDHLLARADREPDGSFRVIASKALPGKPIGRVRFFGTRTDDPNDIVPHEDRRELRGYGVFAAWLNHVDAKAINSLDTLVTEKGRAVVRHHLIDFGSAMGSGGVGPAEYWAGSEYLMEPRQVARQMIGFGFLPAKWHTAPFYESRSIGRVQKSNVDFDPDLWKPRVPNQAFLHARADDKFWAARKLMAISSDMIRAAVRTGEFGDPASEDVLVRALIERRDAIGRAYLAGVNPIVDPVLDEAGTLTFSNAAVDADVARLPVSYHVAWSTFDNTTHMTKPIGETSGRTTALQAPTALPRDNGTFIRVDLSAFGGPHASWEVPVHAYFHRVNGQWLLIGFERMPEAA